MSGREHSDDSSGNLAAGEPTVPEFTVDPSRPGATDPNDTQQDPQVARLPQQDQNVTNDPGSAARQNETSNGTADGDTIEDPLAVRKKEWPDPLGPDDTMEDPQVAGKKVWADPLAPDETVKEAHGHGRKVYPGPLGASAGSENTNWDPVGGTPPVSSSSAQSKPGRKKSGQGFSEGDLFARKYEIKGHIGQGGMGVVYKALDLVLGRIVAIKFLKGKSGISQLEMSRFQQEAKAIASLDHTNIIRVHDMSVTEEGDPFFVLEYLEGHALSSETRGKQQLPLDRVFSIISQVCDALQHAHEHGVIHRDIKPSNLMIVPQKDGTDVVKLLDFGIAKLSPIDEQTLLKLTKTGELFGSPHYMSPEQCTGKAIAEQSDIYSLGCVLYELICGSPPFSGQSALDTLDKHKNASLSSVSNSRKDLPESKLIDHLLGKMMAKEPSERYQTPAELKAAIQEISRKLEGSPFQRFKKKTFPNGLSDAHGKKNVAVIVTALATLAGAAYLVSQIPNSVKTKAPDSVPVPPKPWKSYDLKGQQLFDKGSYPLAQEQFLLAYDKAKSEKSQKSKLHLFTTLQELQMLYTAWQKAERVDWCKAELLDLEVEKTLKKTPSTFSWDDIAKLLAGASSPNDLKKVIEMSRDLTLNGTSTSSRQDTLKMLSSLRRKVALLPNSELFRDQFVILECFQHMREASPAPAQVDAVIARLSRRPVELISPEMANVLVEVGLNRNDINPQSLETFSDYAVQQSEVPFDRAVALFNLSKIYRLSGRKAAARETLDKCIVEAEKQVPRPYFALMMMLTGRADLYVSDRCGSAAIPLYARALAMAECSPRKASFGSGTTDTIRASLASAYADVYKYDEAEKILLGLIENQDPSTKLDRAVWLRQLGLLYLSQKKLVTAEKSFEQSVEMFKSQKLLLPYHFSEFSAAQTDLARVRGLRKPQAVNGANGQNTTTPKAD